jgi:hypothetical protein
MRRRPGLSIFTELFVYTEPLGVRLLFTANVPYLNAVCNRAKKWPLLRGATSYSQVGSLGISRSSALISHAPERSSCCRRA